ncbi:hypothetical protein ACM66B_004594 [Microbotryomycetes sp. NB124-2]
MTPGPSQSASPRADVVSLKLEMASLLSPADGQLYWQAMTGFMTGRINRRELDHVLHKTLGYSGEAVQLHNTLLLSILYNTTRNAGPPLSARHSGWHKRRRDGTGADQPNVSNSKKQRLKATVMAIGKRERAELKAIAYASKKDASAERERDKDVALAKLASLGSVLDTHGPDIGADGLPKALASAKQPPATLSQDYMRALQTPTCYDNQTLPDLSGLHGRMSLIAYDYGLANGIDHRAASLGLQAIEVYIKHILSRATSMARPLHPRRHDIESSRDTSAPRPHASDKDDNDATVTLIDHINVCEASPSILARGRLAAFERLFASGLDSDEDAESADGSSDAELQASTSEQAATSTRRSGKQPKLSRSASSHRPTRAALSRSNSVSRPSAAGREQFVIDPSAVAVPQGHPDVPQTPLSSAPEDHAKVRNKKGGNAATTVTEQERSQLALQHQLFPETAQGRGNADAQRDADKAVAEHAIDGSRSPGHNNTSTDGGSDSEDGSTGAPNTRKREEARRKLWDVVDSVRLLDGVL